MRMPLLAGGLVAVCALAGPGLANAATAQPSPALAHSMVRPAYWAWRGGVRVWVRPAPYYYGGGGYYSPYYGSGYYPPPAYIYAPPPAVWYYPWPGYPPAGGQGEYGGRG